MPRECQKKPEIHQTTLDLIAKVFHGHQQGTVRLNLSETVKLFVGNLGSDDDSKLKQRGDLVLTRETPSGGSFLNHGNSTSIVRNGISINVPTDISGNYTSFESSLNLTFNSANTIEGRFLFFRVKLEDISADQNRIDVDLSGDAFDQCIIHNPAA